MDGLLGLILDGVQIVLLLGVPGLALLVQLRCPPTDLTRVLVYALCLSLLYNISAALVLLQIGVFSVELLLAAAVLPILLLLSRLRHAREVFRQVEFNRSTFVPAVLVASVVVATLLATPHWNFLVAPNMDAGNYEVYGNHFWMTGSFYLDRGELLAEGAAPEWLESHNTWNVHEETGLARPSYLPGYPVLLGIFKADFDSAVASPAVNALLAGISAMLMVLIGLQLIKAQFAVAALVPALFMTAMLFFYGKQMMSEQLGLMAALLVVHAVLESRGLVASDRESASLGVATTGLAVGLAIGLVARLDLYLFVPLLVVGLGLTAIDTWTDEETQPSASLYVWPATAVMLASLVVALLGEDSYLRHGEPEYLVGLIDPQLFIVLYGMVNGIALLALLGLRPLLGRLGPRAHDVLAARVVPWGYVAFASFWFLFLLWAGIIRPVAPDLTGLAHDSQNLVRLFKVTSPVLLAIALMWSPIALLVRGKERGISAALILGFGLVVYRSRHSDLDLWWMRRYIHFVMPLTLLMACGAMAWLRKAVSDERKTMQVVGGALLALSFAQALALRPVLAAEVNGDIPLRLAEFERNIPDDAFVVVLEGDSMVRGLANSFGSLNDEVVLVDVTTDEADDAFALAPPGERVVLVSPAPLQAEMFDQLMLGAELSEGIVEREWVDELREFYEGIDPFEPSDYYIYEIEAPA